MPRGDGTGPMGYGPGTGRGYGPCGRGGYGGGGDYGWHGGPYYRRLWTRTEERQELEGALKDLEQELKAVKERMEELKS